MSTDDPKKTGSKIKAFWLKYEAKIVLIIGFILVAAISFQAGIFKGQKWQPAPLVVEKAAGGETCSLPANSPSQGQNEPQAPPNSPEPSLNPSSSPVPNGSNCAFVGSKNSNKYHLPTCRWAKQIKPENLVCFSSAEDAAAKNYQPDKNCIKNSQ